MQSTTNMIDSAKKVINILKAFDDSEKRHSLGLDWEDIFRFTNEAVVALEALIEDNQCKQKEINALTQYMNFYIDLSKLQIKEIDKLSDNLAEITREWDGVRFELEELKDKAVEGIHTTRTIPAAEIYERTKRDRDALYSVVKQLKPCSVCAHDGDNTSCMMYCFNKNNWKFDIHKLKKVKIDEEMVWPYSVQGFQAEHS